MSGTSNDILEISSTISADEIRGALAEDSDWLTLDEILRGPIEHVEAELADQGLAATADEAGDLIVTGEPGIPPAADFPLAAAELLPFPVARPELVAALHATVMAEATVVVSAPAGSGKSHFVLNEYLRDRQVRADLPHRILVDCAALRMASRISFAREAVWAHFGIDDRGYKAFLADHARDSGDGDALTALMNARLHRGGGVVVFDHVEFLDRSGEIDAWLQEKFLVSAKALGVKVIFIERGHPPHQRPALRGCAFWSLPDVSRADLAGWLAQPALRVRAEGVSAAAILKITGGRPGLLRDFGLCIRHYPALAGAILFRSFRRWRLRDDQFFTDCERLVRAARQHPEVVERVLTIGLQRCWPETAISPAAVRDLLATGAVRCDAGGMLSFASPLYLHRLARLVQPDALTRLALRTSLRELCGAPGKALKRFGEFASDALAKSLGYEKNPVVGLQLLADLLSRWDLGVRIYLRDRDNARLWAPYDRPERIGPLECWMQPDFARAAQSGQVVRADDGRVFVPMISNAGVAGMVIVLEFLKRASSHPCRRQIDVDRAAGVLQGIRPTLAQLVQRLALYRERKFQGKIWFKSTKSADLPLGRHGLLREVGCQSIIVFEKRASCNWVVARFERTGDGEDGFRWTEGFSATRLEAIAHHPSKRGLVLSGEHALDVFPRLGSRNAAVYLHPIPRPDDAAVVAFLFDGEAAALDGHVQAKLSGVAPDLLASAA
jgi:hypothetical protein